MRNYVLQFSFQLMLVLTFYQAWGFWKSLGSNVSLNAWKMHCNENWCFLFLNLVHYLMVLWLLAEPYGLVTYNIVGHCSSVTELIWTFCHFQHLYPFRCFFNCSSCLLWLAEKSDISEMLLKLWQWKCCETLTSHLYKPWCIFEKKCVKIDFRALGQQLHKH